MKPPVQPNRIRIVFALICLCSVTVIVGCDGELDSQVYGIVTLDGAPIGPGVVTFAPEDDLARPAVGAIKADGSYSLKTVKEKGLRAGHYRVAVQVYEQPVGLQPGERVMTPSVLLVPQKYTSVETSNLEFNVKQGKNVIDLQLTSD